MAILPETPRGFWGDFAPIFTRPTFRRFLPLVGAAILTVGRRTAANLLRTAGSLADGASSSDRRIFSQARWSSIGLAEVLARRVAALLPPGDEVVLIADDTVFSHPGRRVFAKARHRDPVRSSHAFTAWRYGRKWVVPAVLVRFPFAVRPWAPPVLVALHRDPADDRRETRRHRTTAQQAIRLVGLMLHRLPHHRFVFVGDSAYGTHELARFADRRRERLTLVSKLHPEANLFEPPPPTFEAQPPHARGICLVSQEVLSGPLTPAVGKPARACGGRNDDQTSIVRPIGMQATSPLWTRGTARKVRRGLRPSRTKGAGGRQVDCPFLTGRVPAEGEASPERQRRK